MADNTIEIIITIRDSASGPARVVADAVKDLDETAKRAGGSVSSLSTQVGTLGGQLNKLVSMFEGVLIGMVAFQAFRLPSALIGGLMDVVSGTEQYKVSLESLIAAQLLIGEGGERMGQMLEASASSAASAVGRAVRDVNERIEDAMIDHAERVQSIQQSIIDAVGAGILERQEQLGTALERLAEQHADRIAGLQAEIAAAAADFTERIADRFEDFQQRMSDMAERYAEQRQETLARIEEDGARYERDRAERAKDLQEKITDIEGKHEDRRARIIRDLYGRTSKEKAQALLEGRLTEQEINDLNLQDIAERLREEDSQYNEAVEKAKARAAEEERRAKEAHDRRVADLQARLAKEEQEYQKQVTKAEVREARALARAQREHDQRLVALNTRIGQEEAAYARQRARLEADAEGDIAKLEARNAAKIVSLEAQLAREQRLYDRQMRDLSQAAEVAGAKMAAALTTVTPYQLQGLGPELEAVRAKAAEVVADLIRWNREIAIWSPYSVEDIQAMQRYYMGMGGLGVETTKKLTQAMVDYGAAHGITADKQTLLAYALAQVAGLGRLQGQEMRQLAQAGMPVAEMAAAVNMNVEEFIETMREGQIPADVFLEGLINLSQERYAGAAYRLATSWAGLGSTLGDIIKQGSFLLLGDSMEKLRLKLAPIIEAIANFVLSGNLEQLGKDLSEKFAESLNMLSTILPKILPDLMAFFNFLGANKDTIKAIFLATAVAIAALVAAIAVAVALGTVVIISFVNIVANSTARIIYDFLWLYINGKRLLNDFWDAIKAFARNIGLAWDGMLGEIGDFIDDIVGFFTDLPGDLATALDDLVDAIEDWTIGPEGWVTQATGAAQDLIDDVVGFFAGLPARLLALLTAIYNAAVAIGDSIKSGIIAGVTGALEGLTSLRDALLEALRTLINSAVDAVNNAIPDDLGFEVAGTFIGIDLPDNPLPHLARGVRNFMGGVALVGEQGPELVNLPRGASVFPAPDTKRMLQPTASYVMNIYASEVEPETVTYGFATLRALAGAGM